MNPRARHPNACGPAPVKRTPELSRRTVVRGLAAVGTAPWLPWDAVAQPTASPLAAGGRVWRVGGSEGLPSLGEAARLAGDGDTVDIAAGDYSGDTAVWRQRNLTVRAVGGRVRLLAQGAHAEGKGIWVVKGATMVVQGLDFIGARVPDRNGAGIRFERGHLTLQRCRFLDNENGLLAANDGAAELHLEGCEFAHNGAGDGYSHNLYVGAIRRLQVMACHFHHARMGHLLKSRAAITQVLYSRLADGSDGQASYEADFANGGNVLMLGNLVQQSPRTENPALIAYGLEGPRWADNRLVLVHNTFVDLRRPVGELLRIGPRVMAEFSTFNNVVDGRGSLETQLPTGRHGGNAYVAVGQDGLPAGERQALSVVEQPPDVPAPQWQLGADLSPRPLHGKPRLAGARQSSAAD